MELARQLASMAVNAVILMVTPWFVIALCVAWFKLSGRIVEGLPMFYEVKTPHWPGLLMFLAACAAILGLAFYLRSVLRRQDV